MPPARSGLEAFKFGVYLAVPALLTFVVASNTDVLNSIIKSHSYVVYPPEGPRPPSPEAVHALARAERERDEKEKAASKAAKK